MRRSIAVATLFVVPQLAWGLTLWQTYSVDRFGTMAEIPNDWTAQKAADGSQYQFTSPDGKATIVLSGGLNSLEIVANAFGIYEKPKPGEMIADRHLDKWGITITGRDNGRYMVRRSMLSCDNKLWNTIVGLRTHTGTNDTRLSDYCVVSVDKRLVETAVVSIMVSAKGIEAGRYDSAFLRER